QARRKGGRPFRGLNRELAARNLGIGADSRVIVDGADFAIAARSVTVLVGPSGSGKSSLIDVLFGVRDPLRGSIPFDGVPLEALDLDSLHARVGYVPQDGQFFHDTIASNLRL